MCPRGTHSPVLALGLCLHPTCQCLTSLQWKGPLSEALGKVFPRNVLGTRETGLGTQVLPRLAQGTWVHGPEQLGHIWPPDCDSPSLACLPEQAQPHTLSHTRKEWLGSGERRTFLPRSPPVTSASEEGPVQP